MEASEKKSYQVTTYLPKEVLDQLKEWMDDNYQRSVSSAVALKRRTLPQKRWTPTREHRPGPQSSRPRRRKPTAKASSTRSEQMQLVRESLIA